MSFWKKNKIIEYYYEITANQEKKCRRIINSPEIYNVWFYHINQKNIKALEEMLSEKITKIDFLDPSDGETIFHKAIQKNSHKLIDFCIKNNAKDEIKSIDTEETIYYKSSHPFINSSIFIKIWENISEYKFSSLIYEKNNEEKTILEELCSDNRNIKKLIWIEKIYNKNWIIIKNNKIEYNKLILLAQENNAQEIVFFLKDLKKIKNSLEKELENKIQIQKTFKI